MKKQILSTLFSKIQQTIQTIQFCLKKVFPYRLNAAELLQRFINKCGIHIFTYKKVPVITLPFMGGNAFSFGVIFAGPDAAKNTNTLAHERGHVIQFFTMGLLNYFIFVAVPSVCTYWYGRLTGKVSNELYYSLPWEHTADIFGKARRKKYRKWAQIIGWVYFITILQITALLLIILL